MTYWVRRQLGYNISTHDKKLVELEAVLTAHPDKMTAWQEVSDELQEEWHRLEKHTYTAYHQRVHVEGDETGVMLPWLIQQESPKSHIPNLYNDTVTLVHTLRAINDVFNA
ncbi:hypothetical protein NDU88_002734 [Pleurodeles waltl]|uniref:Dystrophin n=1 Tax=Pleurodeles waltl TaxID=8319 RepID=A0AAV7NJG3_PLEWA|nr:hypothetical protein NDU88_002734 [Pleurodeles waltl]